MIKCGLLGEKLAHSYSPMIHSMLGEYEYKMYEKEDSELADFMKDSEWNGLNVTIPYKKRIVPMMTHLSDTAKLTGSVNTIVKKHGNELWGYNTDVYGFKKLVEHSGIDVDGKKTLVLGSGGASAAVLTALNELKAYPVVISRGGENNYTNLDIHEDAEVIVNTTPVGMYPCVSEAPLDISIFKNLSGVLDIIANPFCTKLLYDAKQNGIKQENGLYMLVAQAKRSSELFTGDTIPDGAIDKIYKKLKSDMRNIVLIGMPGAGKSTIAKSLSKVSGKPAVDMDEEISKSYGMTPADIICDKGEEEFRKIESHVIESFAKRSGLIISTGGGAVTKEENYFPLHQNSCVVWIKRDIKLLSDSGRPLSQQFGAESLYEKRKDLYKHFADIEIVNEGEADCVAENILNAILSE